MFDYVKLALAVLSIIEKLFDGWRDQKLINEGRDKEIADASLRIFKKTQYAKQTLDEIRAMPDDKLDDFLRSLERKV